MFIGEEAKDIVFTDFGRTWEVLRRVGHAAIRKYAASEHLPKLVAEVVDETVESFVAKHGDRAFEAEEFVYMIVYNVIAQSAYGSRLVH